MDPHNVYSYPFSGSSFPNSGSPCLSNGSSYHSSGNSYPSSGSLYLDGGPPGQRIRHITPPLVLHRDLSIFRDKRARSIGASLG